MFSLVETIPFVAVPLNGTIQSGLLLPLHGRLFSSRAVRQKSFKISQISFFLNLKFNITVLGFL
jgi:hypothetical protein